MGRGSTQSLVRKIVTRVSEGPKSITEIAEQTGLDRTAISKYLGILTESGLLIEEPEGTSKKFTMVPTYRTDTYFGLPLDKSAEKQISSVYHSIGKNWKEITSKKLPGTHAQKIAYEVISSCQNELKIPTGWYIHGGICAVAYDDSKQYGHYGLPAIVETRIKEVTTEYAKIDHAWQVKKLQYDGAKKELYMIKEEVLAITYSPKFDGHPKNSLFILVKKIRKMFSLAPKDPQQTTGILDAYQDLMLDITNKLDETTILSHKREITTLLEAIWKYIALFNFKQDLLKFYSQKVLDAHFKLDIKQQEDEIIELGTQLQSLVPEDEITDPLKKKLHEALSQIKLLSPEESKKQQQELDDYRKKYGLKALNEKLRKDVGLD